MIPPGIELKLNQIGIVTAIAVTVTSVLGPIAPEPQRKPAKLVRHHPKVRTAHHEPPVPNPPAAPPRPTVVANAERSVVVSQAFSPSRSTGAMIVSRPADPWRAEILTLVINDVPRGNEVVYFWGAQVLVPVAALDRSGLARHGQITYFDRVEYVALDALPVTFVVDEDHMALRVVARPEDLPAQRIDLAANRAPLGLEHLDGTSMYVNYGAHAVGTRFDAFAEAGLRIGDALAYSSIAVLPDNSAVRGLTNATWDRRAELQRIAVGDELVNAGPLGGGGVVGGIHLIRGFDLDPYLITAPSIDLTSTVLAPSTADVYVNGVLVRSVPLAPGQYTLNNLPVTAGAGDVRVVVRDALGRQHQLATGYYMASDLLKVGLTDYQVAVGALREHVGLESFDYGGPVAVARYARGLTSNLTAGVRADASMEQAGIGVSLAAGLPFGQLDSAVAASTDRGSLGVAGSLAWSYTSRRGSIAISGRRVSGHYATIDVDRNADRVLVDLRAQASLALGAHTGIGAQVSAVDVRDSGWSRRIAVQSSTTVAKRFTLGLSAGRDDAWGQPREYSVTASLGIALSDRTRASVAQTHGTTEQTEVELHHSLAGTDPGVGFRVLADTGSDDRASGSVQAQTRTGRYSASYTYDEQRGGTAELDAAGGIALIGGRVFLSTPIERSFALVRVPELAGVQASLENHPVGRTDDRGDVLIPNLQPYYGNNISIDAGDLPIDRQLPETHRIVAPPSGGGVVISFAAAKLHLVRGTMQIEHDGQLTTPAYGELTVMGGLTPFVSPLDREGELELDGIGAGSHRATIEWEGGTCTFELVVPIDDHPIVDLGPLRCTVSR